MSISPELEPLAEVARNCKDVEEFVDNARNILRKITTNEIQSLTPRVGKDKPGRVTITRYSGSRFELGIMVPWERTTTLKTLAYGRTEILKYLTDFYNQAVKSVPHEPVEGKEMTERKLLAPPHKQDPWLYTVEELRRMCGENGLSTDGKKEDLIYRLFKLETPPWAAHPGLVWSPRYHAWLRENR